ncbi:MAG: trp RNA-binding attenuation protein MtrB [bacterium]
MNAEKNNIHTDFVIIEALENGVTISSVASDDSDLELPVRLDEGELFIMKINSSSRGYKIRGKVELHTTLGVIEGHSSLIVQPGGD